LDCISNMRIWRERPDAQSGQLAWRCDPCAADGSPQDGDPSDHMIVLDQANTHRVTAVAGNIMDFEHSSASEYGPGGYKTFVGRAQVTSHRAKPGPFRRNSNCQIVAVTRLILINRDTAATWAAVRFPSYHSAGATRTGTIQAGAGMP
jgi:hypothetical protein